MSKTEYSYAGWQMAPSAPTLTPTEPPITSEPLAAVESADLSGVAGGDYAALANARQITIHATPDSCGKGQRYDIRDECERQIYHAANLQGRDCASTVAVYNRRQQLVLQLEQPLTCQCCGAWRDCLHHSCPQSFKVYDDRRNAIGTIVFDFWLLGGRRCFALKNSTGDVVLHIRGGYCARHGALVITSPAGYGIGSIKSLLDSNNNTTCLAVDLFNELATESKILLLAAGLMISILDLM